LLEGAEVKSFTIGPFIADHPWVGWLPYIGALYLEFASILIVFRPAAQRLWAVALICFHVGIYLTLTILFSWQMLLVGIMLLCSPFAPARASVRQVLMQLPLLGDAVAMLRRRGRRTQRSSRTAPATLASPRDPAFGRLPA
jgi:hypothetical protein